MLQPRARLGAGVPSLYHLDATRPEQPHARTLTEEISRVVRARAANPAWIAGMMRHGFRGAAEIAATLEHMAAFAHLAGAVPPHLFDLYYDATLGNDDVRAFMARENPAALAAIETCFTPAARSLTLANAPQFDCGCAAGGLMSAMQSRAGVPARCGRCNRAMGSWSACARSADGWMRRRSPGLRSLPSATATA